MCLLGEPTYVWLSLLELELLLELLFNWNFGTSTSNCRFEEEMTLAEDKGEGQEGAESKGLWNCLLVTKSSSVWNILEFLLFIFSFLIYIS